MADLLPRLVAETAAMVRFYSRLTIPRLNRFDEPAAMPDFGTAARMLPLASIIIGLPAAAALAAGGQTALPAPMLAALALAIQMMTTGVFHEDGLADTADGFGGGWTRARKLEIMKDSRIGSYGSAALILATLIRILGYAGLIGAVGATATAVLFVAIAVISRSVVLTIFVALPAAREDGAGNAAGRPTLATLALALALSAAIAGAIGIVIVGAAKTALALCLVGIGTYVMGRLSARHIQGQTGDVLGATQQVTEVLFLVAVLA
ncbi:MAG: adenosylcobinamide-GDP ribazoletransferase [Hyphomicrobiaceae bacterium]|nr:adenosylcobinamide-GDP ribazoletransferase [Hyphomicrobiaceae bacterium]